MSAKDATAGHFPAGKGAEPTGSDVLSAVMSAPVDQAVIIDFDETLLLRNSTSEYLRSVRPYALWRLVFHALELVRPWVWLPRRWFGPSSRHWFQVVIATVLFPWTPFVWRRQAAALVAGWQNQPLVGALAKLSPGQLVVSSQGFAFILRPLLRQMRLGAYRLDACRFFLGFRDRATGKRSRLIQALGLSAVTRALAVTDSEDDRELLATVARPFLVLWPHPAKAPPKCMYVPLRFMVKVKHGDWGHFRSVIVAEDLLLLWLGLSFVSPQPLLHGVAMVFMLLSLWIIYEIGYMENDVVAAAHEKDPVLKPEFFQHRDLISFREPWLWAILAALPGVYLLEMARQLEGPIWERAIDGSLLEAGRAAWGEAAALVRTFGAWLLVLILLRGTYTVFNHADKMSRIWLYPVLQGLRAFGFAVLSPLSLVGALVFFSTVVSRWILYVIYRAGRVQWPGTAMGQILRLVLLMGLVAVVWAFGGAGEEVVTLQGAVVLFWCLLRVRRPFWQIIQEARHVSADSWMRDDR